MIGKVLLFSWLFLGGLGCSLIQNATFNQTAAMVYKNTQSLENENNWEMFRLGVPANLQLLEGLLTSSPDNCDLLAALAKGFTSYAYLVNETEVLGELLSGKYIGEATPKSFQQVMLNYSKGIKYGVRYLEVSKIKYQDLITAAQTPAGISRLLSTKLLRSKLQQRRDLDVVFFTAQAMIGLVNFRKNDLALVAQVPIAKELFDWACAKKNDLYDGVCGIFAGAYESSRPQYLGGNPEAGKEILQQTIKTYASNYLARIAFIQYYLAPRKDYQGFLAQKTWFLKNQKSFIEDHLWDPPLPLKYSAAADTHTFSQGKNLNLFQQSAVKKFEIIHQYEKEIFFRGNKL